MTTVNSCCKTCESCPNCYDLDIEKIKQYLYAIDSKVVEYTESKICITQWGYGCKKVTKESFEKLMIFREYVNDYYQALRMGYSSGICPDEIQTVMESVSMLINLTKYRREHYGNVYIDSSNFEEWVIVNPYCVAWEDWELSIAKICPKVGIEVLNITDSCNLVYDLQANQIKDECKFLYTMSVANIAKQKNCFDVNVKEIEKCKLKYDILVKEHVCDLHFDTYIKLLECNLSHDVIANLIECDLKIDYNVVEKCPQVITKNGKYNMVDIDINLFKKGVDAELLDKVFNINQQSFDQNGIETLIWSYSDPQLINTEINE